MVVTIRGHKRGFWGAGNVMLKQVLLCENLELYTYDLYFFVYYTSRNCLKKRKKNQPWGKTDLFIYQIHRWYKNDSQYFRLLYFKARKNGPELTILNLIINTKHCT